ncbi:hypothetical protein VTL71DRAFT_5659 [Oculimacula yallundae]|uniref:C2H2-type domain-containing protein n=1 Tax=Oculimacula yallundae TaxID=86028 RepID=A0ABR4BY93_9HELO
MRDKRLDINFIAPPAPQNVSNATPSQGSGITAVTTTQHNGNGMSYNSNISNIAHNVPPAPQNVSNTATSQGSGNTSVTTSQHNGNGVNNNSNHTNLAHDVATASEDIEGTNGPMDIAAATDRLVEDIDARSTSSDPVPSLSNMKLGSSSPQVLPAPSWTAANADSEQAQELHRQSVMLRLSRDASARGSNGHDMATSGLDEEAGSSENDTQTKIHRHRQTTIGNEMSTSDPSGLPGRSTIPVEARVVCANGECRLRFREGFMPRHLETCDGIYRKTFEGRIVACRFHGLGGCDYTSTNLRPIKSHEASCQSMAPRYQDPSSGSTLYPCRYCTIISTSHTGRRSHEKAHERAGDSRREELEALD